MGRYCTAATQQAGVNLTPDQMMVLRRQSWTDAAGDPATCRLTRIDPRLTQLLQTASEY
jgi:hypothetical protein